MPRLLSYSAALLLLCTVTVAQGAQTTMRQHALQPELNPLYGHDLEAASVAGDRYAHTCRPTPAMSRQSYPGSRYVPTTNKLSRPAGKSQYAKGQRVYITGRVYDGACVPLRDAKVEIWHNNGKGELRFVDDGDLASPYPIFTGAGVARTDGRGEYVFETIFPHPNKGSAPYVNIRVTHPSLRAPLTTTMYFAGDTRNEEDRVYRRLNEDTRQSVTAKLVPFDSDAVEGGLLAQHDLIVRTRDAFRGY